MQAISAFFLQVLWKRNISISYTSCHQSLRRLFWRCWFFVLGLNQESRNQETSKSKTKFQRKLVIETLPFIQNVPVWKNLTAKSLNAVQYGGVKFVLSRPEYSHYVISYAQYIKLFCIQLFEVSKEFLVGKLLQLFFGK